MDKIWNYIIKNWITITMFILAIISPFLISWIVSLDDFLWFEMPTSNDWIGFLGSYMGGLFTLLGVLLTLQKQYEQNKKFEDSQFDLTFFKLIDLKNELSRNIKLRVDVNEEEEGIGAFNWLSDELHQLYEETLYKDYGRFNIPLRDEIKYQVVCRAYDEIYHKHERALAHYVRSIFYLIQSIKDQNNIEKYINILRTQLTQSEIIFLYYYCITSVGEVELLPLVKSTGLFNESDKILLLEEMHFKYQENLISLRKEIDEISLFLDFEGLIILEEDDD